jgi:monothiol glutaredoxin
MQDPVQKRIARVIGEHDVVLFMKGTPVSPQCGFSRPSWSRR